LCRISEKKSIDDTISITQMGNNSIILNESKIIDSSTIQHNQPINQPNEEELLKSYIEFLESTSKTMDMLFLCHSKQEFLNMMRERGVEANQIVSRANSIKFSKKNTFGSINSMSFSPGKQMAKDFFAKPQVPVVNEEIEFDNEELKREEEAIKILTDEKMMLFKEIVINNFIMF
jgi:hypothetical protein